VALFRCIQFKVNRTFVIDVPSRTRIKEARAIINRDETSRIHVMGIIVKEQVEYNRPWNWHLDPASIEFFDRSTEICDASIVDLERQLNDVGGPFLPHNKWCPWGSQVIEEIDL
jgi:hypothetical protein